ncbi:MAG: aconitase X [Gammaproteobacteria bacterium]
MTRLQLDSADASMLDGKQGRAKQFAMQTIVAAAEIDHAESLIDISFAHIDSCFYSGRAHLDFVIYLVQNDASLAVPTWTNNGLISLNDLSIRDPYASTAMHEARQLMHAYVRLGCKPVWTCAPYQLPGRPLPGDHIVGSESNAVSFYNSVIGARTNKYGDFFDVCAAISGRVPYTGLHRDEGRRANILVTMEAIPDEIKSSDIFYHLLGHLLGRHCSHRVPVVSGLPSTTTEDDLKAISAACCSSGSVPLFHAVGITPEAATLDAACHNQAPEQVIEFGLGDLRQARSELGQDSSNPLKGIALGTPHFSYTEFERLVALLQGRDIAPGLVFYLTTSRHVYELAARQGWIEQLEGCGVKIITDTCTYFSPAVNGLRGKIMTNAAKWAYYAPGMLPVQVVLGSLSECVESAVAGEVLLDSWIES